MPLKAKERHPILRAFLAGEDGSRPWFASVLNYSLAFLILSFVIYLSFATLTTREGWHAVSKSYIVFLDGWLVTVAISIVALIASTAIGALIALCRIGNILILRNLSRVYVEVIRGTPLLVQIYIFYFGIFHKMGIENCYVAGVLILSGFSGAYISEIIRAGIESVGKSQLESARAIGLTPLQIYRFVIFPQTIRRILPPLAGEFASLIKNSSLLSVIGVNEFMQSAEGVNDNTFSTLESYFPLAVGYLILTLPISLWSQSLEKKHKFET
ncbi:MAG: amino acid ABC transporter permease [Chthoniobacteraceae bacterium]